MVRLSFYSRHFDCNFPCIASPGTYRLEDGRCVPIEECPATTPAPPPTTPGVTVQPTGKSF